MNESFVFYASYHEAIQCLPEDIQLEAYKSICEYAITGIEPEGCNPIVRAIFKMAKPTVKSSLARRENGKLGGAPKGNQNARKTTKVEEENNLKNNQNNHRLISKQPNVNVNVNVNEDVNVDENVNSEKESEKEKVADATNTQKQKVFKKPSLEEIKSFCDENNLSLNVQDFFDYYTSNGWMVGKNHMKDWKAALRRWCRNSKGQKEETEYIDPHELYQKWFGNKNEGAENEI